MSTLKALRKAAGFTQFALAKRAGVSRFRLCLAETGELELRPDEIEAIKKVVRPGIEETARLVSELETVRVADG